MGIYDGTNVGNANVPVEEFAKMLRDARLRFEDSNMEAVLEIDNRMRSVGYGLMVSNGTLVIANQTTPTVAQDGYGNGLSGSRR